MCSKGCSFGHNWHFLGQWSVQTAWWKIFARRSIDAFQNPFPAVKCGKDFASWFDGNDTGGSTTWALPGAMAIGCGQWLGHRPCCMVCCEQSLAYNAFILSQIVFDLSLMQCNRVSFFGVPFSLITFLSITHVHHSCTSHIFAHSIPHLPEPH